MTQIATVEKILGGGMAEISVARASACAHDCHECAGCGVVGVEAVRARARNLAGARVGQKVVVESSSRSVFRVLLLIYVLPVVLFFTGYFAAAALPGEGARIAVAVIAFFGGLIPAVLYDRRIRRRGGLAFTIVRLF